MGFRELLKGLLQPRLSLKYLNSVDREQIAEIARIKAERSSPSTANRYLALIRGNSPEGGCRGWELGSPKG